MQTAKHKFGRDVLLSAAATCVRSLRHFLFLPVLTHGLDQAQLGLWEQVMVGIALAIPWVSLQLPGALVRYLPGVKDRQQQRDITYSIFILSLLFSIFIAFLLAATLYIVFAQTRWQPLVSLLPLIIALIIASTCLESARSYFRALRFIAHHSAISIAQYFGELILVSYALLESSNIAIGLSALLAIRATLSIIGVFTITRQLGFAWPSFSQTRSYLQFSIPLIPNSALYRLFDAGDRYLISHFLSHAAVGVYFVSYTAASFFTTIVSPLHLVLLPALAELWNSGKKGEIAEYITDIIHYTAVLTLPFLAFSVLIPGDILSILTPDAYRESARYIPILALGFLAFSLGIPGDHLLVAAGKTRVLFAVNTSMVIANMGMNFVLIPQIGIVGAALSTLAGHLIYALTVLVVGHRTVPFALPFRPVLLSVFNATLMGTLLVFIKPLLPLIIAVSLSGLFYLLLSISTSVVGKREWAYIRQLLSNK